MDQILRFIQIILFLGLLLFVLINYEPIIEFISELIEVVCKDFFRRIEHLLKHRRVTNIQWIFTRLFILNVGLFGIYHVNLAYPDQLVKIANISSILLALCIIANYSNIHETVKQITRYITPISAVIITCSLVSLYVDQLQLAIYNQQFLDRVEQFRTLSIIFMVVHLAGVIYYSVNQYNEENHPNSRKKRY
jgi:hypothetical protein